MEFDGSPHEIVEVLGGTINAVVEPEYGFQLRFRNSTYDQVVCISHEEAINLYVKLERALELDR